MSIRLAYAGPEPVARGTKVGPRGRIVAVAQDLFYRHGIRAVGVDTIAAAAGTNKMTLYRHFPSKDLLIAECLRNFAEECERDWERFSATYPDDADGQAATPGSTISAC